MQSYFFEYIVALFFQWFSKIPMLEKIIIPPMMLLSLYQNTISLFLWRLLFSQNLTETDNTTRILLTSYQCNHRGKRNMIWVLFLFLFCFVFLFFCFFVFFVCFLFLFFSNVLPPAVPFKQDKSIAF